MVLAIMGIAILLGAIYYATAQRRYAAKAAILVTQTGPDNLNASMTGEESLRRNTMPTFVNMVRSAKVLEGAIESLDAADSVGPEKSPKVPSVGALQANLVCAAVPDTSILEIKYCCNDPHAAVNVVRAIVHSYVDFMDKMHKSTAAEISRVLTKERKEQVERLNQKQAELLEAACHFADMGFRSEGSTLHPVVQRAVFFNDALVAVQKQRADYEASLASVQAAVRNGEDLGQHLMAVADVVGRELVLGSLGIGNRDSATPGELEQSMLHDRADLETLQRQLGPQHPEISALRDRIGATEQFLHTYPDRVNQRMVELQKSQLGPWLINIIQQKLNEECAKERILKVRFEETRTEAVNLSGQLATIEALERDVKRLGDMDDVLLNQIASLDLRQNGPEVRVAVIEEPTAVQSPVSPQLNIVVLSALLGGFVAALALVTILDALDDSFRSPEEIQSRLGIPLLTMVPKLDVTESARPGRAGHACRATAPQSEAYRTLRTAIALTHQDARRIMITSSEAGDGKTTTLANLGICYAQANKRTLLIDADMRRSGSAA